MDFLENIPFIIFNIAFFIIFIAFVFGAIVLAFSRSDPQKIERGKKIILTSLYALLVLLLVALVFFLVSYLVKKGEVLRPAPASKDFPQTPFSIFPPSPEFINIKGYYFSGPWSLQVLKEKNIFEEAEASGLYAILCKKNDNYDIIYIGEIGRQSPDFQCWISNCENNTENLFLAILQTSQKNLLEEIKEKIFWSCSTQ